MKSVKNMKKTAKLNLKMMIDQISSDIAMTEGLFNDVIVLDGSPAQVYSHLSQLSNELGQIQQLTSVVKEEINKFE